MQKSRFREFPSTGVITVKTRLIVVSALLLVVSTTAQAASPEEIARRYFESVQVGDWHQAALYLDPDGLAFFKETMLTALEAGEGKGGEFLSLLFGGEVTFEDVRRMPAHEFFARFMELVMGFAFEPLSVQFGDLEILGSVPEGEEMVHVVARTSPRIQGIAMTGVEVITLRRGADGWFIAFNDELQAILNGLVAGLEAGLARVAQARGSDFIYRKISIEGGIRSVQSNTHKRRCVIDYALKPRA